MVEGRGEERVVGSVSPLLLLPTRRRDGRAKGSTNDGVHRQERYISSSFRINLFTPGPASLEWSTTEASCVNPRIDSVAIAHDAPLPE